MCPRLNGCSCVGILQRIVAKTKNNPQNARWLLVALLGVLLAAPHGTVIKQAVAALDPFLLNVLRFGFISIICSPFIWRHRRLLKPPVLKAIAIAGLYMAVAVSCYVQAVKLSLASYAEVITIFIPIVLVIYSVVFFKQRVTSRAATGISLAGIGALLLVVMPFATEGAAAFYPMATALMLLDVLSYPIAIIQFKKINEMGIPLIVVIGLSSLMIAVISIPLFFLLGDGRVHAPNAWGWFGVIYSGLAVALISRMFKVWSFEHLGVATTGAMMYLETLLGVLLPMALLHEHISVFTVACGLLVLLGVFIVQSHVSLAHHHHHIWHAH